MRLVKLLHVLRILVFGIAFASIPAAVTAQNTVTPAAMTKTYCAPCHSGQAPPGRLSLDQLDANRPSEAPETWERVVRQLRAHDAPNGCPEARQQNVRIDDRCIDQHSGSCRNNHHGPVDR